MLRLRIGFVLIAMVLSFFGARLVQLQGVDPGSYAAMAAAEGAVRVPLVAERGAGRPPFRLLGGLDLAPQFRDGLRR